MPEFNGFNDWLNAFPLYRGKKSSEDDDDDHRIVGKFKVWMIDFFSFFDTPSLQSARFQPSPISESQ